jgi:hypothetical protein
VLERAAAGRAVARLEPLPGAERGQVTEVRVGNEDDIPARPTVAAVRSALGDVLLTAEVQAPVATATRLDLDLRSIVKHGRTLPCTFRIRPRLRARWTSGRPHAWWTTASPSGIAQPSTHPCRSLRRPRGVGNSRAHRAILFHPFHRRPPDDPTRRLARRSELGETEARIVNFPTRPYDHESPDKYRIDPHSAMIPFDWELRDG